ncbi:MAG: hypothetical protein HY644_02685 [Acidobacteria bacterium]|nr:hypothetical protein [Acidobacteriota bacterium]
MTPEELFAQLEAATQVSEVEAALDTFLGVHADNVRWVPVGRENNRGTIEASADPGRSLVERLTNGIDAVLEDEHKLHSGRPLCRSPKEAATTWLNVPTGGLSEMSPTQRRALAQRVTIKLLPGDGRAGRCLEVRDFGIGIKPADMSSTILSLNEGNKLQKHYLAGTYGQGGSSTFAVSKYTLVATRHGDHPSVGFTLVKFLDLPAEEYKTGHYVYLTFRGGPLEVDRSTDEFPVGTSVKHFGYDLSSYPSPLGPNSVYGLLNQVLFDPVMPVWLDNPVNTQRRVIKGSRNALNGATDEGDDRRGPNLSHSMRLFYVSLGEFGRIGIEYWVLEQPSQENKKPVAAFVNPNKTTIFTLNGQNHAELSHTLVKKDAELPFLTQRLICHVDCNSLTPTAKRALFVSNREDARRGVVYDLIEEELIRVLKSDDDLARLNNEAREQSMRSRDESAVQQMRTEVARLLRLQGLNISEGMGSEVAPQGREPHTPTHPPRPRPTPRPIDLHEPPTYIRLVWNEDEPITFYPEQRRYLRVETDAHSRYHNPDDPARSAINLIVTGNGVATRGSTPLQGGRLRVIFDALQNASPGATGMIRVELTRQGLPALSDERPFDIRERPPARPEARRISLPPFEVRSVTGPEDVLWNTLGWPEDTNTVASSAVMEQGLLVIYFSMVFPKYAAQRANFETRDPALAASFAERYKIWLAVHSLLLYRDQQVSEQTEQRQREEDPEFEEAIERQERCRIATLSAMFAAREVQAQSTMLESD